MYKNYITERLKIQEKYGKAEFGAKKMKKEEKKS